jgi:1,4-alpha-glucan branching enzyme
LKDLNSLYRQEQSLHELDCDREGFEWIDLGDREQSILCYLRKGKSSAPVLVVCNFTPVTRFNYRVGVPAAGFWKELLNSDSKEYGGSGSGNFGGVDASPVPFHGRDNSLSLTLPPLGIVVFRREAEEE